MGKMYHTVHVAGVTKVPEREKAINDLPKDSHLTLELDIGNRFDPNAIGVWRDDFDMGPGVNIRTRQQLGWIPKVMTANLAPKVNLGLLKVIRWERVGKGYTVPPGKGINHVGLVLTVEETVINKKEENMSRKASVVKKKEESNLENDWLKHVDNGIMKARSLGKGAVEKAVGLGKTVKPKIGNAISKGKDIAEKHGPRIRRGIGGFLERTGKVIQEGRPAKKIKKSLDDNPPEVTKSERDVL